MLKFCKALNFMANEVNDQKIKALLENYFFFKKTLIFSLHKDRFFSN